MTRFREIGRNVYFWAKKGIFGPKLGQNGIFWAKSENVTSVPLESPNFVPNSENCYERILRSLSNGRTDARTDRRTDGCEFIGSARNRGEPKIKKYIAAFVTYKQSGSKLFPAYKVLLYQRGP